MTYTDGRCSVEVGEAHAILSKALHVGRLLDRWNVDRAIAPAKMCVCETRARPYVTAALPVVVQEEDHIVGLALRQRPAGQHHYSLEIHPMKVEGKAH